MLTTGEVLWVVKDAETAITATHSCKQPQKYSAQEALNEEEDKILINEASCSDSDCIIIAACRQQLKLKIRVYMIGYTGNYVTANLTQCGSKSLSSHF